MSTTGYRTGANIFHDGVRYTVCEARCVTLGRAAALLIFNEGKPTEEEIWVPYSLIQNVENCDPQDGKPIELLIASWFLKKNGIE